MQPTGPTQRQFSVPLREATPERIHQALESVAGDTEVRVGDGRLYAKVTAPKSPSWFSYSRTQRQEAAREFVRGELFDRVAREGKFGSNLGSESEQYLKAYLAARIKRGEPLTQASLLRHTLILRTLRRFSSGTESGAQRSHQELMTYVAGVVETVDARALPPPLRRTPRRETKQHSDFFAGEGHSDEETSLPGRTVHLHTGRRALTGPHSGSRLSYAAGFSAGTGTSEAARSKKQPEHSSPATLGEVGEGEDHEDGQRSE